MPNVTKMTTTKKDNLSVAFRFLPKDAGTQGGPSLACATLKVWGKEFKRAIKAENDRIHNEVHKGVSRAARRAKLQK